jgi:hypothetical protein
MLDTSAFQSTKPEQIDFETSLLNLLLLYLEPCRFGRVTAFPSCPSRLSEWSDASASRDQQELRSITLLPSRTPFASSCTNTTQVSNVHISTLVEPPLASITVGPSSSTANPGRLNIVYRQSRVRRDTQGFSTLTPPFVPAIEAKAHHSHHATGRLFVLIRRGKTVPSLAIQRFAATNARTRPFCGGGRRLALTFATNYSCITRKRANWNNFAA